MRKDHFRVIELESKEGKEIITALKMNGAVGLFGSAVSKWKPTEIPSGQEITKSLANILTSLPVVDKDEIISGLINMTAFEHIMEACPENEKLGDNLVEIFYKERPNLIHFNIAELLKNGLIKHIITTNYDSNIEAAYNIIQPDNNKKAYCIVNEKDSNVAIDMQPIIFKIHGCAHKDKYRREDEKRTMIYTLNREGEMASWKRDLMRRILSNHTLLICGYSGLDFEICPEIPAFVGQTIWNCRDISTLSPNARRVLNMTNGIALVGDIRSVLNNMAGIQPINIDPNENLANLKEKIIKGLDDWDLNLWRIRLFRGIGCANEGVRISKDIILPQAESNSERLYEAFNCLGASYFHQGAYKKAANYYEKAAIIAKQRNKHEKAAYAKLDQIEAERCTGHWFKAWHHIQELDHSFSSTDNWIKALIKLRKVLIIRDLYRLTNLLFLWPISKRLRNKCKPLLKSVVEKANELGRWLELQQCELWARRIGIPFSEIYSGAMIPLPSKEGYKQLGYFIAQTMAVRDAIKVGDYIENKESIRKRLEIAWRLGAYPEYWKLTWVLLLKRCPFLNKKHLKKAAKAWRLCEYTLSMRLFLILNP